MSTSAHQCPKDFKRYLLVDQTVPKPELFDSNENLLLKYVDRIIDDSTAKLKNNYVSTFLTGNNLYSYEFGLETGVNLDDGDRIAYKSNLVEMIATYSGKSVQRLQFVFHNIINYITLAYEAKHSLLFHYYI
jgi:hypothetical protein